jgi:hypothetical protein
MAAGGDAAPGGLLAPAGEVAALLRDLLARRGEATWVARGASMRGAISDGQVVRLVPPGPGRPRPGDVVMAELPGGGLVVHRVVAVDGERLRLRGDACRRPDPPVRLADVVGVVDPTPPRAAWSVLWRLLPGVGR